MADVYQFVQGFLEGIIDTNGKNNYSLSVKEFTDVRRLAQQLLSLYYVLIKLGKTDYEVVPLDSILTLRAYLQRLILFRLCKLRQVKRTSIYS